MKYVAKTRRAGSGKKVFIASLSLLFLLIIIWYIIVPKEMIECDSQKEDQACGCPINDADISRKNIILIDTTDYIPQGKFPDIEYLIRSYTARTESWSDLVHWLKDGKRTEMTSVYLLSDKVPSDMVPIGKFCRPPPEVALAADNSKSETKLLHNRIIADLQKMMIPLKQFSAAKTSPIIETLSVVTSNSTAWSPGGDLIVVSDMLQNSAECGWFEISNPIPQYPPQSGACKVYIDKFKHNIQSTALYPLKTNIAVCMLPEILGKSPKQGLHTFWRKFSQDSTEYDLIETCDPSVIKDRMTELNKRK